jgi:hypothetical protein
MLQWKRLQEEHFMKRKIIAIILAAALAVALAGCANPAEFAETEEQTGPRDTPQRIGESILEVSLNRTFTLEEAINFAELVVDITILGWLGENEVAFGASYFSAKVNHTFKGEQFDVIEIAQLGNSRSTIDGFPLFKKGDRLLLSLYTWPEWDEEITDLSMEEWNEKYKGRYYIVGSYIGVLDIWEYESSLFILSRFDETPLPQSIIKSEDVAVANNETRDIIAAEYAEYDPVFELHRGANRLHHGYAFYYDDVARKIARIANDQSENNDEKGEDEDKLPGIF